MIGNAVVTHAEVKIGGYQDTMLGLYVTAKFADSGHGMVEGHYSLYLPPSWKHHSEACPLGHVIHCWLQATGVNSVADMVGQAIRVDMEKIGLGYNCNPDRVGHIVDEDKWFSTKEICERFKASKEAN